jgi:DNA polymerase III epsilon subunit-like protein
MCDSPSKLTFFDLETGGLNARRHPIIQLAAVAVDQNLEPLEAFEAKIRFDPKKADQNSLRKNHYSPGQWAREASAPKEVAEEFGQFLRRHAAVPMLSSEGTTYHVAQLVAHNAGFDGPFLQAWYERLGVYLPARYQVLCTVQRAMWFFEERRDEPPPPNFKLATLCQHFGVSFHAASAHEALADVAATVNLYRALLNHRVNGRVSVETSPQPLIPCAESAAREGSSQEPAQLHGQPGSFP